VAALAARHPATNDGGAPLWFGGAAIAAPPETQIANSQRIVVKVRLKFF
jgi:hypothetical protein